MILLIRTYLLRLLLLLTGLLTVGEAGAASVKTDTLHLRFRLDSIHIDMGYIDNAKVWRTFEENYQRYFARADSLPLRIDIYSGASPEGPAAHNIWLGESRGVALQNQIRKLLNGRETRFVIHNEGPRWDALYAAIAASDESWRDEVLRILEQEPSKNDKQRDHREQKLRALHDGKVWPVMLDKYLAPLRSGSTAVLSFLNPRDTVYVRDTVVLAMTIYPDRHGDLVPSTAGVAAKKERGPVVRQPVWILRTNLPLLGLGTPNIQAELSLDRRDRWSVNVEGVFSWWTFSRNAYANQIIYGSVELRRWLGDRSHHHTLDGWHVGLGIGGGYGDVEWKSNGYQAEVFSGFVNIGWQHRFGKRRQWAFDAGIGLGYAYIPYRRYEGSTRFPVGKEEEYDDHLMYQETRQLNWFGTPHVNISIGYVFSQRHAADRRKKSEAREAERQDYQQFKARMKAEEKQKRADEKKNRHRKDNR